ncbi:MAG: hypothetical protein ABUS57_19670, partial [Pseudomonadota bacterium]
MKIALVIGAGRGWLWLRHLAEALSSYGSVDVLTGPGPRADLARAWVRLEQKLFRLHSGAKPVSAQALGAASLTAHDMASFDLVIDLSGTLSAANLTLKYDGRAGDAYALGRLLKRETPVLTVETASGEVVVASYPAIEDREVLARALTFVFARSAALVQRAVAQVVQGRRGATLDPFPQREPKQFSLASLIAFAVGGFARKIAGRLAGKRRLRPRWLTALRRVRTGEGGLPAPGGFTPLALPGGGESADPFLLGYGGTTWLFVEKMKPDGRGVLAYSPIDADGVAGSFSEILDEGDHMSYPFVFEHDGAVWMLPETGVRKSLCLLRAVSFPDKWRVEATLLAGAVFADATLFRHGGLWWVFAAMAEGENSTHDELYGFWSETLTGPWSAHVANPLKSDARSARPAGKVIEANGRLLRPAQNCERHYG